MKTLVDATLFVVKGPKGSYYAICENESGAVITARTEQAAALLSNERDMVLVDRREITHDEMLKVVARHGGKAAAANFADPSTTGAGFTDV